MEQPAPGAAIDLSLRSRETAGAALVISRPRGRMPSAPAVGGSHPVTLDGAPGVQLDLGIRGGSRIRQVVVVRR